MPVVTTDYTWNARNQLVGISGPGVNATFVYDGLGRREKKTVNGDLTEFLFDGINPVQETSGATVIANILPGPGIDEYFARTDVPAGATSSFLLGTLGSSVALADSAGTIQTEYTYEPFGRTTVAGATNTNPFQYTGRENDGTGLYYYRARYYHPGLQRFTGEDPLISQQRKGNNLYVYVDNNPIRYFDPLGLDKRKDQCKPKDCLRECLEDLAAKTVDELRDCLAKAGLAGVAVGVLGCGLIGAFQPYLLPAFPACSGITAGSTVALGAALCLGTGHINLGAGIAGCLAGCLGG